VQAATAQEAFEELALSAVRAALIHRNGDDTVSDGLVLTGGCALNIKVSATGSAGARSQPWPSRTNERARASFACVGWQVNQLLAERYGAQRVYVPSAPNDSGLGIGMIWALHPPPHTPDGRQDLSRLGPPIWDAEHLHSMIAERLPLNADARAVAHALAQGSIVGVVRGRTEARPGRKHDALQPPMSHRRRYRHVAVQVGPRALGHRSLLGVPGKHPVTGMRTFAASSGLVGFRELPCCAQARGSSRG
jgi:carbamoyltransferase